jgi:hypothetical protein
MTKFNFLKLSASNGSVWRPMFDGFAGFRQRPGRGSSSDD